MNDYDKNIKLILEQHIRDHVVIAKNMARIRRNLTISAFFLMFAAFSTMVSAALILFTILNR